MSWATNRTYHGVENPSFTFVKDGEDVYTVDLDVGDHWYGEAQSPIMEIMDIPLGEPPRIMLDGTRKPTRRGIHFGFALFWPTADEPGRARLALAMSWLIDGGQLKFKPHRDKDDEYYVELLEPALSRYVAGSSSWIGYELAVECQTVYPLKYIPANISYDYWCAVCKGLILDGNDDGVAVPHGDALNTSAKELIMEVVWTPQNTVADGRIISKASAFILWQVPGGGAGGRIEAVVFAPGSTRTDASGWAADLVVGRPYLVRAVANGTDLRVYVQDLLADGPLTDMGSTVACTAILGTSGSAMALGRKATGAERCTGTIYNVRIIDPADSDRVMYWAKLIEGTGATVQDFSRGQNHGIIAGGAVWYEPSYGASELAYWCSVDEVAEHDAGEYDPGEVSFWTPNPQTLNPKQGTFN